MMLGWFRGSVAATLMSLIPGCEYAEWNQRMTVVVATPEGERSGSNVVNVWWGSNHALRNLDGSGVSWKVEGEAVVVDLGSRGTLLALLKAPTGRAGDAGPNASFILVDLIRMTAGDDDAIAAVLAWPKGKAVEIEPPFYPMLITFRDFSDPKTIVLVDPNDLAATFGAGVRLERITLETTNEPVSPIRLSGLLPCYGSQDSCVPFRRDLAASDPLNSILNDAFWSMD